MAVKRKAPKRKPAKSKAAPKSYAAKPAPPPDPSKALANNQHERFCQLVVSGKSDMQAFTEVGLKDARGNASRLAKRPNVRARIEHLRAIAIAKTDVSVQRIVDEYAAIAFTSITEVISFDPKNGLTLKSSDQLTPAQRASIAEVSETVVFKGYRPVRSVRLKMHSKTAALEALGKHLQMFVERLDVRVRGELQELLARCGNRMPAEMYAELLRIVAEASGFEDLARTTDPGSRAEQPN